MIDTDNIQTREQFVTFVYYLRDVYRNDPNRWENNTIESFLDALAGWVEDMDGAYLNWNKEMPRDINWSILAKMLDAATDYE